MPPEPSGAGQKLYERIATPLVPRVTPGTTGLTMPCDARVPPHPPRTVREKDFGSYARGAIEVGDVDLAVEFHQTKDEAGRWVATLLAGGFDHLGVQVRRAGHDDRLDLRVFEKVFVVGGPPHAP